MHIWNEWWGTNVLLNPVHCLASVVYSGLLLNGIENRRFLTSRWAVSGNIKFHNQITYRGKLLLQYMYEQSQQTNLKEALSYTAGTPPHWTKWQSQNSADNIWQVKCPWRSPAVARHADAQIDKVSTDPWALGRSDSEHRRWRFLRRRRWSRDGTASAGGYCEEGSCVDRGFAARGPTRRPCGGCGLRLTLSLTVRRSAV